ncbi:MAG: hypothetical protein OEU26_05995 [Candidatus Tectomicrobia bacterium]|nr:hypothetical protein [Candidatus Tectomicrobia bacterium]
MQADFGDMGRHITEIVIRGYGILRPAASIQGSAANTAITPLGLQALIMAGITMANDLPGGSPNDRKRGDRPKHGAAHSNNRTISNRASGSDADIHTNPHISTDHDALLADSIIIWQAGPVVVVVAAIENQVPANMRIGPDFNPTFTTNIGVGTDMHILMQHDLICAGND